MAFLDELNNGLSQFSDSFRDSNILDILGYGVAIVIVSILLFVFVVNIVKLFKGSTEYVGATERIGMYKIGMRNKSYITGNVNRNNSFLSVDIFERLKKIPQIKNDPLRIKGLMDIEQLWMDGLFFAYDMKVFDSFKSELPSNKVVLISPVKIDDAVVSWQDEQGEFSITGSMMSMFKRYPRHVFCSEATEFFDLRNIHGKIVRVYILSPYTEVMNKQLMVNPSGKVVPDVLHGRQICINMINLPNKEDIAKLSLYIGSLNDLYKQLDIKNQEITNLVEQREELHRFTQSQKKDIEGYKARLKTHFMIGEDHPFIPIPPKSLYLAVLAGIIGGYVAVKISTMEFFTRYQGIDIVFLGVVVVVSMMAVKMFEKKETESYETKKMGSELR